MNESVSGVKKVDVFNDIVSRLEDSKKAKVSEDVVSGMKNYYGNKEDYRNRVGLLAENLNGVKPIDNEVNNVVYLSNYVEKGIAIRTSIVSFKQIWIEYRLIYNENSFKEENRAVFNQHPMFNIPDHEATIGDNFGLKLPTFGNDDEKEKPFEMPNFDNVNNNEIKNADISKHEEIPSFSFNNVNLNVNKEEPKHEEIPTFGFNNISTDLGVNENVPRMYDFNAFSSINDENNLDTLSNKRDYNFDSSLDVDNYKFSSFNMKVDDVSNNLDDNYKKLYTRVEGINRYVDNFNHQKVELDRQISALEQRKKELSSELRELENAKREFSRYKANEEKKITKMKNDVNNRIVSMQNLIDNLDNILGKIN